MKRQKSNISDGRAKKKLKKSVRFSKNLDNKKKRKVVEKNKKALKHRKSISKDRNDTLNKENDVKVNMKRKSENDMFIPNKKKNINIEESLEKPNWLEYKKQQKELREKRRAKKLENTYDISVKAKQIGEELRRTKLPLSTKEKLTKNLFNLIQNQYAKLVFSHDTSRVIQWQLKFCEPDIQLAVVEELKPNLLAMFYSKYAKNIISTLLKKGTDSVKKILVRQCNGQVIKLLSSVISAPLFEKLYVESASPDEKIAFKQEFYGDMYKKYKDPNIKILTDVYKNAEDMKAATLSSVKINISKILNKNLINSSLVHTVLYEFLSNCSKDDRAELITMVRPLIADLSQTKDGAKAANLCIWHGTSKDRKLIMKSLKDHTKDIVKSEHGHLIILGLLDCVDDTLLVKKILLQEILNNLNEIVASDYGRRVILHLVARRDRHYFHPELIEYLKTGDENTTSKKPAEIRQKELLDSVIDVLLENIKNDIQLWLSKGSIQLVTLAILKACQGDKSKLVLEAIAKFITNPGCKLETNKQVYEVIEEPGLHLMLKKLIQMDSERVKKGEITFGEILLNHLSKNVLNHWISFNRGCFLLITLLKNESDKTVKELKSRLQKMEILKSTKHTGASILLKQLN